MIVLDAGALLALERDDRKMWSDLNTATKYGIAVIVPVGALAQVWRGGPRQARLAMALKGTEAASFDDVAKAAGVLCGRSGTSDVVDASVAITAAVPGVTRLYTYRSDGKDLALLLETLGSSTKMVDV